MAKKWVLDDECDYQAERLKRMSGKEYEEQLSHVERLEKLRERHNEVNKRGNGTKKALIAAGGTVFGAVLAETTKLVIKKLIFR